MYLTTVRILRIAAAQFTLICVRETVIVSEARRTETGEVIDSIDTGTTIVAWIGATGVEVCFTVFALRGNRSVPSSWSECGWPVALQCTLLQCRCRHSHWLDQSKFLRAGTVVSVDSHRYYVDTDHQQSPPDMCSWSHLLDPIYRM